MSSAISSSAASVSFEDGSGPGDSGIETSPSLQPRSKPNGTTGGEKKPRVLDKEGTFASSSGILSDFERLGVREETSSTSAQQPPEVSDNGTDGDNPAIPDDPFDNEKSRILFDAIDRLQSWGSHKFLDIPQLVIVGEQSSGKSSLLKTLTDIPFPVKSGCGTRFPIRVVSRRTAPGSSDSFRIVVEQPPHAVAGLEFADATAYEYLLKGGTLSMAEFEAALEDLSENYIGIRKGRGQLKRNFVPDVVKVELSGPNRSPFSILDLPGLVSSQYNVNPSEVRGTHELAKQYISREENIVICTIPATSELSNQPVFDMCVEKVKNKERLIGVFTKCDAVRSDDEIATLVSSANGNVDEGIPTFLDGAFVVCNKVVLESGTSTSESAEQEVFGREAWSQIKASRKGSTKLKNSLGEKLASRIETAFPLLEKSILAQLHDKLTKKAELGEPCNNHSERQAYLNQYVRKYSDCAVLALRRPGILESSTMELRQEIKTLNDQFGTVMRFVGMSWTFQDLNADPHSVIKQYKAMIDDTGLSNDVRDHRAAEILTPTFHSPDDHMGQVSDIPAFNEFKRVETLQDFAVTVEAALGRFGASQPPGVINSDIYPVIYRLQVSKWGKIAQEHLQRVKDALRRSYEEILTSVCPDSGSTSILHQELNARLQTMFSHTSQEATRRLEAYSKQETEAELLQTNNPEFNKNLQGWRFLRYARAFRNEPGNDQGQQLSPSGKQEKMWENMDFSSTTRMVYDIHDVVKVYYEIALESFIRHVSQTIVEGFVMDKDGPLSKLTSEYVLGLSEEEVKEISREDGATAEMREQLKADIAKLQGAQQIAQTARDKVNALKAA
ncbi:hypothetical protein NM208_g1701 [Fusarium decemcellulare]|uniref:Uncharacterized protein n=1 Tax=Fusarium decemcellulare TaxID=57161 RepID=A0ACC1SV70_9HYPO|nr:hypothetical protein NM208_g1701 [Fusarium decemcellulare]